MVAREGGFIYGESEADDANAYQISNGKHNSLLTQES
jgi:hypothetical protein